VSEGRPATRRQQVVVDALTARELEVLHLVVCGYSTEQMAGRLGVSRHTIRTHVQQVLRKLGVHGRGKLARAGADAGLVDVDELAAGEQ
jgi:DNA-binding NarL/FixJ family response regulator